MRTATQPTLFDECDPADEPPDPVFELRFRPAPGGRWKRVGVFGSLAEAVALIRTAGDWHIVTAPAAVALARAGEAFDGSAV